MRGLTDEYPERNFLTRWWVNDMPAEPKPGVADRVVFQRNGPVSSVTEMHFIMEFHPESLNAKKGDKIGVQLLFCPRGQSSQDDGAVQATHLQSISSLIRSTPPPSATLQIGSNLSIPAIPKTSSESRIFASGSPRSICRFVGWSILVLIEIPKPPLDGCIYCGSTVAHFGMALEIIISTGSEIPLYEQIFHQIRTWHLFRAAFRRGPVAQCAGAG